MGISILDNLLEEHHKECKELEKFD